MENAICLKRPLFWSTYTHSTPPFLVHGFSIAAIPERFAKVIQRELRLLLTHNSLYYPAFGGGDKSNRLLMAALAARGHHVAVLARVEEFGSAAQRHLANKLAARGIEPCLSAEGLQFLLDGVIVRVFTQGRSLRRWAAAAIREFQPDVILASTDDPGHLMLDAAARADGARVVYLIRALIALPFGPCSPHPNARKTEALRHLDGVAAVSEYVAAYARKWGRIAAVHVPISLPDRTEYNPVGSLANRFVTLINPCAGKGQTIFMGLARRMPEVEFAAVPTWGTTPADLEELRLLPNITVMPPIDDVDQIYAQSRVVLVPSLWAEARSRVPLEALARGIPVLASNVGGMDEAMLGMDYLLPVKPVERYRPASDRSMVPAVEVPPQDVGPWAEVLTRLLGDRELHARISAQARARADEYVRSVSVAPFEAYLQEVLRFPRKSRPPAVASSTGSHPASALSAEKRSLLIARLRRRQQTDTETR
jgi:glycosyltransferase involved in cell wall biosynthesis